MSKEELEKLDRKMKKVENYFETISSSQDIDDLSKNLQLKYLSNIKYQPTLQFDEEYDLSFDPEVDEDPYEEVITKDMSKKKPKSNFEELYYSPKLRNRYLDFHHFLHGNVPIDKNKNFVVDDEEIVDMVQQNEDEEEEDDHPIFQTFLERNMKDSFDFELSMITDQKDIRALKREIQEYELDNDRSKYERTSSKNNEESVLVSNQIYKYYETVHPTIDYPDVDEYENFILNKFFKIDHPDSTPEDLEKRFQRFMNKVERANEIDSVLDQLDNYSEEEEVIIGAINGQLTDEDEIISPYLIHSDVDTDLTEDENQKKEEEVQSSDIEFADLYSEDSDNVVHQSDVDEVLFGGSSDESNVKENEKENENDK
jgi:hypothetical protein